MTDPDGAKRLACALIEEAVKCLDESTRATEGQRERAIRFFLDPKRSAPWCEIAGLDWDYMVDGLRRRGVLPEGE